MTWNTSITPKGIHDNPRIILAPNTGIPSNTSIPPAINLVILIAIFINTPNIKIISFNNIHKI